MKLNRRNLFLASTATITLTLSTPSLHAQSGNWTFDGSGNWGNTTAWTPTGVPGTAAGDVIGLNNNITAARTVTIDAGNQTAGILNIGDSDNTHAFTLARTANTTHILILDNGVSNAEINETGSIVDAISAPIRLDGNLTVNMSGILTISGNITETGSRSLTKTGAGSLYLTTTTANTWSGGSTVSDGVLSFRTLLSLPASGTHAFGNTTTLGLGVGTGNFTIAQVNDALNGTVPTGITIGNTTRIGIDTGLGSVDFNIPLAASSRGLDKLGGNNLTLSGNNSTYDGDIRVVLTRILPTNSNALGSTVGSTTVLGGGGTSASANTLDFSSANTSLAMAEKINFFGNSAGRARLALANNSALTHTLSGAIDVTSDTNITEWNSGGNTSLAAFKITGDITGNFTSGGGLLLRGNAHGNATLTPINTIEGNVTLNLGITKTDSGTWQLGASGKTYKAPNLGVANGLLRMGVNNYLDTVTPVRLDMGQAGAASSTLDLNGFSQTVGGINLVGTGSKTITTSSGTPVLTVDNAANYTTGSLVTLTGNMSLVKTGVGTQTLGADNTYTGATIINGGTLQIGEGGTTGSIANTSSVTNNATLIYNSSATSTSAYPISGNGTVEKLGTGNVILSGNNTYSGTTTVTQGVLTPTLATALSGYNVSGRVILNGGTIGAQVGGSGWTTGEVDNLLANATKTSGALGIDTINGNLTQWTAFTTTNLGSALGLNKLGNNTLTLDQANTYTGTTTVSAGTLKLTNAGALGSSPNVSIGAGTTLQLATGGNFTGPTLTMTGGTLFSDNAGVAQIHTFGNMAVSNTQQNFTSTNGLDTIQVGNITNSSGGGGTATFNPTTANLIIAGGYTNTVNAGTNNLALGGTSQGNSIAGTIENGTRTAQSVTKSGTSTWTLSGNNTYTGATTVSAGTLQIDAAAALPSASQISLPKTGVATGTLKLNTSGTNVYANTFGNFSSSNSLVVGGTANIQNAQGNNTMSGDMIITAGGGNGVNIVSDAGLLTISGNLSTGTGASGPRPYTFSGAGNGVFSGEMIPFDANKTPAILKHGAGTWSITGTNSSFTGGVNVLDGVLNVASVANTGTNSSIGAGGPINLNGMGTSGTLQYTGSTAVTTNHAMNVAPTGGTLDASGTGSGTLKFTGTFTATNASATNLNYTNGSNVATNTGTFIPGTVGGGVMTLLTPLAGLVPGTTITSISGNSYTLSNPFTGTTGAVATTYTDNVARTLTLTGSNAGANEISSNLVNSAGGGTLSVSKSGVGTWVLSGNNTYSGNTIISAGTLVLSNAANATNANTGNDGSTVSIAGNATLDLTYTGTDIVDKLFIGGVQQPAGIYGPTATNIAPRITNSSGNGTLTVLSNPPLGFSGWITGTFINGTVPALQQGPNADFDNDGISNLVEYAIAGQDPTVPNATVGSFNGTLLSFSKRLDATGLTYAIQDSTDLGITDVWAQVPAGPSYINNASTISYTLNPGTPPKNFLRLQVLDN